jgi:hypothetical protein
MNHRSLLDYLAENFATEDQAAAPDAMAGLEKRLADMEHRLSLAFGGEAPATSDEGSFSSRIESIVRGRSQPAARNPEVPATTQRIRIEPRAPSLAPELPEFSADGLAEFQKFVEAVHLVGQAANRFMPVLEPRRTAPVEREPAAPVDKDAIRFTLALKDAVTAIQSIATELSQTAADLKRATAGSAAQPVAERRPPIRTAPREDAELEQLRGELEDLQARMGAYNRRKSGARS